MLADGRKQLTKKQVRIWLTSQESVLQAIDNEDCDLFRELGGTQIDLNFEITEDGVFPLLIAAGKGK